MSKWSQFDLQAAQARTERARNPAKAAAKDAETRERWAAGEEKKLQDAIQQYAEMRGCYVLRARMDRKSTLNHAHPDLTIWGNGRCCLIECKVDGGRLSDAQTDALAALSLAGAKVTCMFNLKDSIAFIKEHLCL